jgi:hypothetical protein
MKDLRARNWPKQDLLITKNKTKTMVVALPHWVLLPTDTAVTLPCKASLGCIDFLELILLVKI